MALVKYYAVRCDKCNCLSVPRYDTALSAPVARRIALKYGFKRVDSEPNSVYKIDVCGRCAK